MAYKGKYYKPKVNEKGAENIAENVMENVAAAPENLSKHMNAKAATAERVMKKAPGPVFYLGLLLSLIGFSYTLGSYCVMKILPDRQLIMSLSENFFAAIPDMIGSLFNGCTQMAVVGGGINSIITVSCAVTAALFIFTIVAFIKKW